MGAAQYACVDWRGSVRGCAERHIGSQQVSSRGMPTILTRYACCADLATGIPPNLL